MTDDAAVARFEALVQTQGPAAPWAPVTPFDRESRRRVEGMHPQVLLATFQPSTVLDYGCGPGHLLAFLKELDPAGAHGFFGYDPQATGPERFLPAGRFDLVICREVLEHVPVRDLSGVIRELVSKSGRFIYVTTRFAKQPDHFLSVETEFEVDPTHITCLTKPFLRTLFVLEGCTSRPDLEAQMDWQRKGRCLVFEVA